MVPDWLVLFSRDGISAYSLLVSPIHKTTWLVQLRSLFLKSLILHIGSVVCSMIRCPLFDLFAYSVSTFKKLWLRLFGDFPAV